MRDDDDLMGAGQLREAAPDLHCRPAADAGVDLVEHHGGAGRLFTGHGERDLQGQHHPGQLATGGALGQRQHGHVAVGGKAELDLVDTVRAGADQLARRQRQCGVVFGGLGTSRAEVGGHPYGEFGIGHRQPGQFRGDLLGQLLGCLAADLAEIDCGLR
jgi:hypothetical protein